jgi:hypothetical protein
MCRLMKWKDAVEGLHIVLARAHHVSIVALLALPAAEFGSSSDQTIKKMIEDRPQFKTWQWKALALVCRVLSPFKALIKLLVGVIDPLSVCIHLTS